MANIDKIEKTNALLNKVVVSGIILSAAALILAQILRAIF